MARKSYFALLLAIALSGCAKLYETSPLEAFDPGEGYRPETIAANRAMQGDDESLFVILSISGGGTRSAALGYGVMERLRDTKILVDGEERNLLQEVDVIAGVSGGAFPAAYYAAFGDRLFEDFGDRFLFKNVSRALGLKLLWPDWVPVVDVGRSDKAAALYDKKIFDGATYGDLLARKDAPFLVINGTEMSTASSFAFTQAQFDLICGDLSEYPVARAVAASAAFPVLLSPLTVQNRAGDCDYPEKAVAVTAADDATDDGRPVSKPNDVAKIARSLKDSTTRPYIHILDGGIADYLGLRTVLQELDSRPTGWKLSRAVAAGRIDKFVVIVVDAWTDTPPTKGDSPEPPGVVAVIEVIANSAIDQSRDGRKLLQDWLAGAGSPAVPLDSYYIYVGFEDLPNLDQRDQLNSIPATFSLSRKKVHALRAAGAQLLEQAPEYRRLVEALQ